MSVVTPTFNAGRYLEDSIRSVLGQTYPNIEYLVVDSHSTDDTPDILDKYSGRLRTIRSPRLGPASAIHIGLSQARGSILAWLNADDTYEPDAVQSVVTTFLEHPGADIVYGDAQFADDNGAVIRPYPTIPFDAGALERECFISQPAAFFRASVYREYPLDPSLPVSFDYDLWIRLAAARRNFQYVPQHFASTRMHRECLTLARRREVFEVTMDLLKKHYGYVPLSWIFGYLSYLLDGRDQFFEPVRSSPFVFIASLPFGIALNLTQMPRVMRDWGSTAGRGLRQSLSRLPIPAGIARRIRAKLATRPAAPEVGPEDGAGRF